jgi:MYXO-CTERM domain-containing protein
VRVATDDVYGMRGDDIAITIHVGDGSTLASPLRQSGSGGGGAAGLPGIALAVAALAWMRCRRRAATAV